MQSVIKKHLKSELRQELEYSCFRAGVAAIVLLVIYQFAIHKFYTNSTFNYCMVGALIFSLILRFFLPYAKMLSDQRWLDLHTLVILSHSILWSLVLSAIAFTDLRVPELHIITALLFIGLVAAAAFSLAVSKRDFYSYVTPLIFMQVATFFVFDYDITFKIAANLIAALFFLFLGLQRKRIELNWQNVRIKHFELQQIVDAVPGGISMIKNGRYTLVNKYVRNRVAIGKEIIGQEFGLITGKDSQFFELISKFRISSETRVQFEVPLQIEDDERHHLVTACKSGDEIIISATDIHELKAAQYSLMHTAKMASLGEMSSGLSHEINNPVAIISMRAQQMLLALKKGTANSENQEKGLEIILATSERITRITRGLRNFSQTYDDLSIENASLKMIVEDALALCQEKFKNSQIELITEVPEFLEFNCNSGQISQVILNALNNSFDAIIGSDPKWIKIRAYHETDFVTICISDSGPGIPAEIREKIMQPFFTTKEVGKGTGLGLSISKGIVESHKGQFYFNFETDGPTELRIVLPMASRQAAV